MAHPAIETAAALLRDLTYPIIMELGCNDGGMGHQIVAELGRPCSYFGVECDPRALAAARANPPGGGLIIEAAVSDEVAPQTVRLSVDGEGKGRGRGSSTALKPLEVFFAPANFHWLTFPEQVTVPGVTVDLLFDQFCLDGIDLLWADIEGSEAKMLAGAVKALPHVRLLYLETWAMQTYEGQVPTEELLAPLLAAGWTIEWRDPNHYLLRNPVQR